MFPIAAALTQYGQYNKCHNRKQENFDGKVYQKEWNPFEPV